MPASTPGFSLLFSPWKDLGSPSPGVQSAPRRSKSSACFWLACFRLVSFEMGMSWETREGRGKESE